VSEWERLYLPKSWTQDAERLIGAGVPAEVEFATKPALAQQMLTAALDAGVPAAWVAGDEVYGADPTLRKALCGRGVGYVLAVAKNHQIPTGIAPAQPLEVPSRWPCAAEAIPAGCSTTGEPAYPALTCRGVHLRCPEGELVGGRGRGVSRGRPRRRGGRGR
jgi:SRSO17 transposase